MSDRNFMDLLQARWDEGKFVCVGLDTDISKMPAWLQERLAEGQVIFNEQIIEATHDLVCAYKPNLAFYQHASGKVALQETIQTIRSIAPGVPVILDAKQADIGNTNIGYATEDFDWYHADAVTVHPYLGREAMAPFLERKDKGVIVLVRTSNPGAGEFQDLICETHEGDYSLYMYPADAEMAGPEVGVIRHKPLYKVVAQQIATEWNYNGNCCVVAGATYPEELAEVRRLVGDMPILIPGIGKQGGDLEATVKAGANSKRQGMIINSSSGIIFAGSGRSFAEMIDAARSATQKLHDDIEAVLATV